MQRCGGGKWKWWITQQCLLVLSILAYSQLFSKKWLWTNQSCFLCVSGEGQMQAPYISIIRVMSNDGHLCDVTTAINYGFYVLFFMEGNLLKTSWSFLVPTTILCLFCTSWWEETKQLGQGHSWAAFCKAFIYWWSQLAETGFAHSFFSVGKLVL